MTVKLNSIWTPHQTRIGQDFFLQGRPYKIATSSSCYQLSSTKTLRVLNGLEICTSHFIKVLEYAKIPSFSQGPSAKCFVSTLSVTSGAGTTQIALCHQLSQFKLGSSVNGLCNILYGVECVLKHFQKGNCNSHYYSFSYYQVLS